MKTTFSKSQIQLRIRGRVFSKVPNFCQRPFVGRAWINLLESLTDSDRSLYFPVCFWLLNLLNVNKIPFQTFVPEDSFFQSRIVGNIMVKSLTNDNAFQKLIARVFEFVWLAADAIPNEVAGSNRMCLISYGGLCFALENIYALFFKIMNMKLSRLVTRLHFNDVKPDAAQSGKVTKRLIASTSISI